MAKMIPPQISPEIKSNAERKVFDWFRDAPDTGDWIVLHSLGIANHRTSLYGEIDFVVLAPKLGVFVLEVKGGDVSRIDGIWYFTDRYGNTSKKARGPFEQANDGMFSLIDAVKAHCSATHQHILFGSAVMFPDIIFDVAGIDAHQWQVFDKKDGQNVAGFIHRLAANCRREWEGTHGSFPPDKIPDNKAIKELVQFLRGDFDKAVSLSAKITETERELVRLTNEQLNCLDQLEDNERCLIQGAAGTGKTLLALEAVKRSVVAGEKTAFFCFNAMLSKWVKDYFAQSAAATIPTYTGTFHDFMIQAVKDAGMQFVIPDNRNSQFWQTELPLLTLEAIEKKSLQFDKIVIDEAQDLFMDNYFEVLDAVLLNGFDRGKWCLFGDFTRQAIFNTAVSAPQMLELLDKRTGYAKYRLSINCRNTKQIGAEIKHLTHFDTPQYLRADIDGQPVRYYVWKDVDEQEAKLEAVLKDLLKKEKIAPADITMLSPLHREDSAVYGIPLEISDYAPQSAGLTFSTIRRYKGLENAVIILADITSYEAQNLLYVGLSRARSLLIVFESEAAHKERMCRMAGRQEIGIYGAR